MIWNQLLVNARAWFYRYLRDFWKAWQKVVLVVNESALTYAGEIIIVWTACYKSLVTLRREISLKVAIRVMTEHSMKVKMALSVPTRSKKFNVLCPALAFMALLKVKESVMTYWCPQSTPLWLLHRFDMDKVGWLHDSLFWQGYKPQTQTSIKK